MNFKLKINHHNLIQMIYIPLITMILLSFSSTHFTLVDMLKFLSLVLAPFYLLIIVFYLTSRVFIENKLASIYYFGWIKKTVKVDKLEEINHKKNIFKLNNKLLNFPRTKQVLKHCDFNEKQGIKIPVDIEKAP